MKKFLAIYIGTEAALERAGWKQLDDKQRKQRDAAGFKAWMEWGTTNAAAIVDRARPWARRSAHHPRGSPTSRTT